VIHRFMCTHRGEGSYRAAFEKARDELGRLDPQEVCRLSGARFDKGRGMYRLPSLGRVLEVAQDGEVVFGEDRDAKPLRGWQILALHYLCRADGIKPTGELVSYRDLPDGNVFWEALKNETLDPFTRAFGRRPEVDLQEAAEPFDPRRESGSGVRLTFPVFPGFPVQLRLWPADEEVLASSVALFDSTACHYLHIEDVAVAAGLVVRLLIRNRARLDAGR